MPLRDSMDKIIGTYFAAITTQPFSYKGKDYTPKILHLSPQLFRYYTCPPACGGCCSAFSLDYIRPDEKLPMGVLFRIVNFDGRQIPIYSDLQTTNRTSYCRHLDRGSGLCGIHGRHPFSCDFELLRFLHFPEKASLLTKQYGRSWNMLRVDGRRGALCEIIPMEPQHLYETYRKLLRLKRWTEHFGLETCIDLVLEYVKTGPHASPLNVDNRLLRKNLLTT